MKKSRNPSEKRTKLICQYCGEEYTAFNKKSKYGCTNLACNESAEKERKAREAVYQKELRKRKKIQLLNYIGE